MKGMGVVHDDDGGGLEAVIHDGDTHVLWLWPEPCWRFARIGRLLVPGQCGVRVILFKPLRSGWWVFATDTYSMSFHLGEVLFERGTVHPPALGAHGCHRIRPVVSPRNYSAFG